MHGTMQKIVLRTIVKTIENCEKYQNRIKIVDNIGLER